MRVKTPCFDKLSEVRICTTITICWKRKLGIRSKIHRGTMVLILSETSVKVAIWNILRSI